MTETAPPTEPPIQCIVAPNPGPMTSQGTNTWIIGQDDMVVIDPGPEDAGHVDAIGAAVRHARSLVIVVTHGHLDHVGAAPALRAQTGAPIAALAPQACPPLGPREAGLPERASFRPIEPDIALDPENRPPWDNRLLTVHHMPGHTRDHLCLGLGTRLFCGDLVLPDTPSVVAPPEGSIRQILSSLETIAKGPWTIGMPGHGPVIADLPARAEALIHHRQSRLAGVRGHLNDEWQDIDAFRRALYDDVPAHFQPAVNASIMAQLFMLEETGMAEIAGEHPYFQARRRI